MIPIVEDDSRGYAAREDLTTMHIESEFDCCRLPLTVCPMKAPRDSPEYEQMQGILSLRHLEVCPIVLAFCLGSVLHLPQQPLGAVAVETLPFDTCYVR